MVNGDTLMIQSAPLVFATGTENFLLPGAAGVIDISTSFPTVTVQNRVMIICHPHPLQGGTMENKVVTTLQRTFNELGFKTVRFNFRGVGLTTGTHDHGIGEAEDLKTIIDWVRQVLPEEDIWLAGFSFGSFIAYKVAVDPEQQLVIKQLITIAPPVQYPEFHRLPTPQIPWLVVQGEADEIVDAQQVFAWLEKLQPRPTVIKMPQTSHFFHGKLIDLKQTLKNQYPI